MIFKPAKQHLLQDHALLLGEVSTNDVVYLGVFRVLFGFRVRAGFVQQPFNIRIDWCAGGDWSEVERAYAILKNILSSRAETYVPHRPMPGKLCPFYDLPTCSQIKPISKDVAFLTHIHQYIRAPLELVTLAKPCPYLDNPFSRPHKENETDDKQHRQSTTATQLATEPGDGSSV